MIFIPNHHNRKPAILNNNEATWLADYLQKRNIWQTNNNINTKKEKENAENKYKHDDIKNELKTIFNNKCAYCESSISVVSYGEIEHFAPKSQYPQLCFEWSNLLLSCSICNNKKHNGTKFPLDSQGQPLLIQPIIENPNLFLHFVYNPLSEIAEIEAINGNPKGKETIKIFGLNSTGRISLLKQRSEYVQNLIYIAIKAGQDDPDAQTLMQKAVQSTQQYAAFARQLWVQLQLSPDLSTIVV
jgi:uncharacterized protein (TIGR02646 family)